MNVKSLDEDGKQVAKKQILRSPSVQKVLQVLKRKNITAIEPALAGEKIIYPQLQETGLPTKELINVLDNLTELRILRKEVKWSFLACPECNAKNFLITMACPACGSANITRGKVIEHLSCGYVDLETAFKEEGALICPKCGKRLKALGVDYRRPPSAYKCLNCGSVFPSPSRKFTCPNGHVTDEIDLATFHGYAYYIIEKEWLKIQNWLIDFDAFFEDLKENGWCGEFSAQFTSRSGIVHTFTMGLWRGEKKPEVLIEVCSNDKSVASVFLLAFHAKSMEFPEAVRIFFAMPKLATDAKKIAETYNIKVIEGENWAEAVSKLKALLRGL